MLQRLITLAVWALLAWTLMLLLLRLLPAPLQSPAQALAPEAAPPASLSRLFGATAPTEEVAAPVPAAASRFRLIGVVAPDDAALQSERGVALLTIDGGPPRAYRVGDAVDGELQLLMVEAKTAFLGSAGVVQFQLGVPALPPASTGTLPTLSAPSLPTPVATAPPPPPTLRYPVLPPPPEGSRPRRPPPDTLR